MLIVDLFGWWYLHGWSWIARKQFIERSSRVLDFFSIPELLRTLFAPFRQDSFQAKGAPLGIRLQALGENIISRCIGLLIRLALIVAGIVMLIANVVFSVVAVLVWPLLPLSPVIAIILLLAGVGKS